MIFGLLDAKPCRTIVKLPQKVSFGTETCEIEANVWFLAWFLARALHAPTLRHGRYPLFAPINRHTAALPLAATRERRRASASFRTSRASPRVSHFRVVNLSRIAGAVGQRVEHQLGQLWVN